MGTSPPPLPEKCFVYGAGTFGRRLSSALEGCGTTVVSLIDAKRLTSDASRPVVTPEAAQASMGDLPVLLGVCNPEVDVRLIEATLRSTGFGDVWTPVDAAVGLGRLGGRFDCYWLTSDLSVYAAASAEMARARDLLGDATSVSIYDGVLEYRRTGRTGNLPTVEEVTRQYLGEGLDFIKGPVRLLDAGAFTGDTVRNFVSAGVDLEAVVALEPDAENFARMTEELDRHPGVTAIALPVALSSSTELVSFDADSTAAARVSTEGDARVLAISGDDLLHGWDPTHVKMDIEGSEPAALRGLQRTLTASRPGLAISAYHEPEHLWTLLLWLAALDLGYQFFLRCYGHQTFDTVLYAVPQH